MSYWRYAGTTLQQAWPSRNTRSRYHASASQRLHPSQQTLPLTFDLDPGRAAVEYKQIAFDSSIGNGKTPYQGVPTDESEALWEALYHRASHLAIDAIIVANLHAALFSRISYDEARIMPNKTAPDRSSGYIVNLNVFHDLHCLHSIRTFTYHFLSPAFNATHNPYTLYPSLPEGLHALSHQLDPEHLDHCIDVLRQSLMCAADITPNVFQYSPKHGQVRPRSTVLHECRDFDRIKKWAVERDVKDFEGWGTGPEVGRCAIDFPGECA